MREAAPTARTSRSSSWRAPRLRSCRRTTPRSASGRTPSSGSIGAKPLLLRVGGSLPVMSALEEKGMPTILTGFDLPEGNIHSPNERFRIEHIALGVATAKELYTSLAGLP